jgi:acetoin utilization deacetylase AcuC-like enzyme
VNGGDRAAFALCRPPGHHAGHNFMAGYCYINNAAVAAQWFLDHGAKRVSILDVDYHHGNGTQEIFYSRADVQVVNLHADPMQEYPYFLGHADESGAGAGEGFNINYPMRWGTDWETWNQSLEDGCSKLREYAPDVVLVSLGVDTYEKDPISKFKLRTEDFPKIGARIAKLGLPTLFVMEGGYAVADIGVNAVGVLTGFEGG